MGRTERSMRQQPHYGARRPSLTIAVQRRTNAREYCADKFRTVPADGRRMVHAQLAAIRTKRARPLLRCFWQVWTSHLQQQWTNARRGREERCPRQGLLYGVDVNSGRYADWRSFQSNRRESRMGWKLRWNAEQAQSQWDRKCRDHRN